MTLILIWRVKSLEILNLSKTLLETVYCNHMLCSKHNSCIQSYYDQIVNALIEASRETIPVNQSKSSNRPCIAGWNDRVSITKEKALF